MLPFLPQILCFSLLQIFVMQDKSVYWYY